MPKFGVRAQRVSRLRPYCAATTGAVLRVGALTILLASMNACSPKPTLADSEGPAVHALERLQREWLQGLGLDFLSGDTSAADAATQSLLNVPGAADAASVKLLMSATLKYDSALREFDMTEETRTQPQTVKDTCKEASDDLDAAEKLIAQGQ